MRRRTFIGGAAAVGIGGGAIIYPDCFWDPWNCLTDGNPGLQTPTATPTRTPDQRTTYPITLWLPEPEHDDDTDWEHVGQVAKVHIEAAMAKVWPTEVTIADRRVPENVWQNGRFFDWCPQQPARSEGANIMLAPQALTSGDDRGRERPAYAQIGGAQKLESHDLEPQGYGDDSTLSGLIHELGHCIGLEHCDGGTQQGAISPMYVYCADGTYLYRFIDREVRLAREFLRSEKGWRTA